MAGKDWFPDPARSEEDQEEKTMSFVSPAQAAISTQIEEVRPKKTQSDTPVLKGVVHANIVGRPWEVDRGQADEEILQMKETVVDLLKAYEEKVHIIRSTASHARERIKESFHDLYNFMLKAEKDQLDQEQSEEAKAVQNLDNRVLDLVRLSASIGITLSILDKRGTTKHIPQAEHQIQQARAKLQAIGKLEGTRRVPAVQLREWRGLRHIVKPVPDPLVFNRQSANPNLSVSSDLRQVMFCSVPFNLEGGKECFMPGLYLLGHPGFQCGQHYWEVDVGLKTNWIIGVAKESVQRKEHQDLSPQNGYWVLRKAQDHVFYCLEATHLCFKRNSSPMKIGIFLDLPGGRLSFYDADNAFLIFNLFDLFVKEPLFAFFCPGIPVSQQDYCPLTLCN